MWVIVLRGSQAVAGTDEMRGAELEEHNLMLGYTRVVVILAGGVIGGGRRYSSANQPNTNGDVQQSDMGKVHGGGWGVWEKSRRVGSRLGRKQSGHWSCGMCQFVPSIGTMTFRRVQLQTCKKTFMVYKVKRTRSNGTRTTFVQQLTRMFMGTVWV